MPKVNEVFLDQRSGPTIVRWDKGKKSVPVSKVPDLVKFVEDFYNGKVTEQLVAEAKEILSAVQND